MLAEQIVGAMNAGRRLVLVQRADAHRVELRAHEDAVQVARCRTTDDVVERRVEGDAALEVRGPAAVVVLDLADELDLGDAQLALCARFVPAADC